MLIYMYYLYLITVQWFGEIVKKGNKTSF